MCNLERWPRFLKEPSQDADTQWNIKRLEGVLNCDKAQKGWWQEGEPTQGTVAAGAPADPLVYGLSAA